MTRTTAHSETRVVRIFSRNSEEGGGSVPHLPAFNCRVTDLWTVAQTCWGEARGEPMAGLYAVAHTIRNRAELHPRWRGTAVAQILSGALAV